MLSHLPECTGRWRRGELPDPVYAGVYFLLWQIERHGPRFASRRNRNDPRPDAAEWLREIAGQPGDALNRLLCHWFDHYQFLGVIPNVPSALCHWIRGHWPLRLLERIPSPREVLEMQVSEARPVTVLSTFPRMMQPVLAKPDAFAFMVHDLEHAYKFMHDPDLWSHQAAFFGALRNLLKAGRFMSYAADAEFGAKFDYLISDMNTHPVHSLQYLQAILVDSHLRREGKQPRETVSPEAWQAISHLLALLEPVARGVREPACPT